MKFFVTLEKFIAQLNLEILSVPGETDKIQITSTEVNRPGLLISGFSENFDPGRIQILGKILEDLSFFLKSPILLSN